MTLAATGSMLSQISLIVAIALFLAILIWLWRTPTARWRARSELPLKDAPMDESTSSGDPLSRPSDRSDSHV